MDELNKIFNDIKLHPLEYLTMLIAFLGATFSSDINASWRGLGFFLWIFSNGYMLIGFIKAKNVPYSILFILYEIMNTRGVWNSWFV